MSLVRPNDGGTIPIPRFRLEAEVDRAYAEVTFAVFVDGGEPIVVEVDDAHPHRVYWNNSNAAAGAAVEIMATAIDPGGSAAFTDRLNVTIGER